MIPFGGSLQKNMNPFIASRWWSSFLLTSNRNWDYYVIPGGGILAKEKPSIRFAHLLFYFFASFQTSLTMLQNKNPRKCGEGFSFAEREGFEPSVPVTQNNGFRDRPDRPLRHLSIMIW
jgi:hypothetical protein